MTTVNGIDVSHYQGSVDWTKILGAGLEFAFIKATDGLSADPKFSVNWNAAAAAAAPNANTIS